MEESNKFDCFVCEGVLLSVEARTLLVTGRVQKYPLTYHVFKRVSCESEDLFASTMDTSQPSRHGR